MLPETRKFEKGVHWLTSGKREGYGPSRNLITHLPEWPEWPESLQLWRLDPRALSASWMTQHCNCHSPRQTLGIRGPKGNHPSIIIKSGLVVFSHGPGKKKNSSSGPKQILRTYPTQSIASAKQGRGRFAAASAKSKRGVSGTAFLVVGSGGGPGPLVLSAQPSEMVRYHFPSKTPYSRSLSFLMSSSVSGVQPPQEHRKPYVEYSPMVDPP